MRLLSSGGRATVTRVNVKHTGRCHRFERNRQGDEQEVVQQVLPEREVLKQNLRKED